MSQILLLALASCLDFTQVDGLSESWSPGCKDGVRIRSSVVRPSELKPEDLGLDLLVGQDGGQAFFFFLQNSRSHSRWYGNTKTLHAEGRTEEAVFCAVLWLLVFSEERRLIFACIALGQESYIISSI